MDIERQSAQSLSDDMRQMVLEECKKKAAPHPFDIAFDLLFLITFGRAATLLIKYAIAMPKYWYIGLLSIIFAAVPAALIYSNIIRPRKRVRMVCEDDYTYYMGELTDKKKVRTTDSDGHTVYHYHLIVDKEVKCSCSHEQYKDAVVGRRYIVVFFNKEKPEFCISLPQKDII